MAWQLVYTSAPELLDAGRTGFGTVAKHDSIRPALQTELERVSQFSREQGLGKERILFCHRVIELRGERFHVLSRIRDAGADYTGRTNHIAHHIVLTSSEAASAWRTNHCTPVDMMLWISEQGIWRDHWGERSRLLGADEEIAIGNVPSRISLPAVTWGSLTGSASNGAILAPGGSAAEGCWLLYRSEQTSGILPAIGESLLLHPDPWGISFSSDTQPTDRIEELRWRGVTVGSPLEQTARQSVRPVLDIGNPSTLPAPVAAAANQAETGLLKAPLPSVSSRQSESEGPEIGITQSKSSPLPETTPISGSGRISQPTKRASLKERMGKGSDLGRKPKAKGFPFQWAAYGMGVFMLAALGIFVCKIFVFDASKVEEIINSTHIIINKLNDQPDLAPDQAWWDNEIKGTTIIGNYQIVTPGFKSEFQEASIKLKQYSKQTNKTELGNDIRFENKKILESNQGCDRILAKVVNKICDIDRVEKERVEKDNADKLQRIQEQENRRKKEAEAKARAKSEQIISLKIDGKEANEGTPISCTNGQKFQLEPRSSGGGQVSLVKNSDQGELTNNMLTVNGSGTYSLKLSAPETEEKKAAETNIQLIFAPPCSKITQIEFFDSNQDAWGYFFQNSTTYGELPGWSYCQTNEMGSNIIECLNFPLKNTTTNAFQQFYPQNQKVEIVKYAKTPASCFFKKNKDSQEITLTITIDTNGPITNSLGFSPIVVSHQGEQYKCELDPRIAPCINLLSKLTNSGKDSISYSLCKDSKGSPEKLAESINDQLKLFNKKIAEAEINLKNEQEILSKSTNENSQIKVKDTPSNSIPDDLDKAGEVLSSNISLKKGLSNTNGVFPKNLLRFSNTQQANKPFKKAFTDYLNNVFKEVINLSSNGISYTAIQQNIFINDLHLEPDFKYLQTNQFNGNGYNSPNPKNDDQTFINNIKVYFSSNNLILLKDLLNGPKPTPTPRNYSVELSKAKGILEQYINTIDSGQENSIEILSGTTPILLFKK